MAENEEEKEEVELGEFQTGFIVLVPHDRGPIVVLDVPEDMRTAYKMKFSEELTPRVVYSAIQDLREGLETDNMQVQVKRAIESAVKERNKAGKIVDIAGRNIN